MVDGFPRNPDPADHDRIFPEGMFKDPMDPFDAVILGGHDHEGAPIPIAFQQVRKLAEWSERLAEEGPTEALVGEINARVTELETRYPGSPVWDRQRRVLAHIFLNEGHADIAMDFVHGMFSPHQMARSAMALSTQYEERGGDGSALAASFTQRLHDDNDVPRYLGFVRALTDQFIEEDPDSEQIGVLEEILASHNPDFDPVQSWVDSQRLLDPDANWDSFAAHTKDDEHWSGVPLNFRRYAMKLYTKMCRSLTEEEPSPELARAILRDISACEEKYPEATTWEGFRLTLAQLMLKRRQPALTCEFAREIKDAPTQHGLMVDLLEGGWEDDALELAMNLRDPKLMAAALLGNDGWKDGAGLSYLGKVIENEEGAHSIEVQISCMEVVRDRFAEQGNIEAANRWSARIQELQQKPEDR